ncbi:MAG: hypothetical protein MJ157_05385, partial [Clostridia bacterium]|nr:hypothetical protein [Clostridia bacterium]
VDQISWADINQPEYLHFQELIQEGAVGLLNTATAGERNPDNNYLTVGSSSPSVGYPWAATAKQGETGLYQPNYQKLLEQKSHYKQDLGGLGEALRQAGLAVAVWGNADLSLDGLQPGRQAVTMFMDHQGRVAQGEVDFWQEDASLPWGFRTDTQRLKQLFGEYYDDSQVLVIEFGDTTREAYYGQDTKALSRADQFLGWLMSQLNWQKDALLCLAPTPNPRQLNNTFTPLLMRGAGIEPGLLTSDSTRRVGVISNLDLAPTILSFFNVPVPELMYGEPLQSRAGQPISLTELENNLVNSSLRKVPVLLANGIYFGILLLLGGILAAAKVKNFTLPRYLEKFSYPLFFSVFLCPGAVLFLGFWPQLSGWASILLDLLLVAGLTALVYAVYRQVLVLESCLAGVALVFVGLVTLDLLFGSQLMLYSPLGYDLQRGARFYGLGNEYLGLLIGSEALGLSCFYSLQQTTRRMLGVLLVQLELLILFALPTLGSNAGSSLTLTAVFISFFILWNRQKLALKKIVLTALALALLIALLFGSDFWSSSHSHIGKALQDIQLNGWWIAGQIITRKLLMNLALIKTNWLTLLVPSNSAR